MLQEALHGLLVLGLNKMYISLRTLQMTRVPDLLQTKEEVRKWRISLEDASRDGLRECVEATRESHIRAQTTYLD